MRYLQGKRREVDDDDLIVGIDLTAEAVAGSQPHPVFQSNFPNFYRGQGS